MSMLCLLLWAYPVPLYASENAIISVSTLTFVSLTGEHDMQKK